MRTLALVLVCLACAGYGSRVNMSSQHIQDGVYEEHHKSPKAGNTTHRSQSLPELEQSRSSSGAGVNKLVRWLAVLLLALPNPANSFAPNNAASALAPRHPWPGTAQSPAVAFAPRKLRPANKLARHWPKLAVKDSNGWHSKETGSVHNDDSEEGWAQKKENLAHVKGTGVDPEKKAVTRRHLRRSRSKRTAPWNDEDALNLYWKHLRTKASDLLTPQEEKVLARHVQKSVRWNGMLDVLERRLRREATLEEWAKECGFESVSDFSDARRVSKDAKSALILSNMRLVVSIAKRYRYVGGSLSLLDLIQEGTLGLDRAIQKFDPEKGIKVSTYAYRWIQSMVMTAIENKARPIKFPSKIQGQLRKLKRTQSDMSTSLGRPPTDDELMERLQYSPELYASVKEKLSDFQTLQFPISTEDISLKDQLRDTASGELEAMKSDVEEWLQILPPPEREVLQLRFGLDDGDAMTYPEIAKHYGIPLAAARSRVRRALQMLRVDNRFEDLRDYLK